MLVGHCHAGRPRTGFYFARGVCVSRGLDMERLEKQRFPEFIFGCDLPVPDSILSISQSLETDYNISKHSLIFL